MRVRGAWGLALLGALGCATAAPPPEPAVAPAPPAASTPPAPESQRGQLLRPDQIFEILEQSKIAYDLDSEASVPPTRLVDATELPVPRSRPVDAYIEVRADGDGPRKVESRYPPPEIAELFGRASDAFAAERWDEARALYQAAIEVAPGYFKTYTYLGNTLLRLGAFAEAEATLQKALSLNPSDYQALIFLGDTYFETGQFARAKGVLLRAFVLNRGSDAVEQRLDATLAKLDLKRRDGRLAPPFRVERTDEMKVSLRFDGERGMRWLAMAACMACWTYEDGCRSRSPEADDPLHLAMFRECLVNQAASVAIRRDEHPEAVGEDEARLLASIEDGFLEAIIFWEVVGETAPLVIYLLPEAVQADIVRYIERHLLVSTRLI
ncbi:MAG: tetratricopeptide repeat protein [Deltaproteobacteria bacterium]|nr:tetratricopeptide repeat protein [Deltaproteobacteria bacterium]